MFDNGFFGGLFDFNKNGKLEPMERALDFAAFMNVMESTKPKQIENDDEKKK